MPDTDLVLLGLLAGTGGLAVAAFAWRARIGPWTASLGLAVLALSGDGRAPAGLAVGVALVLASGRVGGRRVRLGLVAAGAVVVVVAVADRGPPWWYWPAVTTASLVTPPLAARTRSIVGDTTVGALVVTALVGVYLSAPDTHAGAEATIVLAAALVVPAVVGLSVDRGWSGCPLGWSGIDPHAWAAAAALATVWAAAEMSLGRPAVLPAALTGLAGLVVVPVVAAITGPTAGPAAGWGRPLLVAVQVGVVVVASRVAVEASSPREVALVSVATVLGSVPAVWWMMRRSVAH